MRLGIVEAAVWGTRQAPGLSKQKLLRIRTSDGAEVTAVDALGAGPGELVLVAHGSRVRDLTLGSSIPTKDVVVAIVDDLQS